MFSSIYASSLLHFLLILNTSNNHTSSSLAPPSTAVYFLTYETAKTAGMQASGGAHPHAVYFAAGACSELIASLLFVPLEVKSSSPLSPAHPLFKHGNSRQFVAYMTLLLFFMCNSFLINRIYYFSFFLLSPSDIVIFTCIPAKLTLKVTCAFKKKNESSKGRQVSASAWCQPLSRHGRRHPLAAKLKRHCRLSPRRVWGARRRWTLRRMAKRTRAGKFINRASSFFFNLYNTFFPSPFFLNSLSHFLSHFSSCFCLTIKSRFVLDY